MLSSEYIGKCGLVAKREFPLRGKGAEQNTSILKLRIHYFVKVGDNTLREIERDVYCLFGCEDSLVVSLISWLAKQAFSYFWDLLPRVEICLI